MSLKRSLSVGLGKLLGNPVGGDAVESAATPARGDAAQAITARIARKHRDQITVDAPLAASLLEFWRMVTAHFADDEDARLQATRMAELNARLAALAMGELPDLDTCRGMLEILTLAVPERFDAIALRVRELAQGSREFQRKGGQHQLTASHLRDELDRCRTLIDQECARRGMTHIADDPLDLHTRLARLFEQLAAPGSRAAPPSDPIIALLEKLIESNDADALRTMPEWVKRPAARILELIAERNRYQRLLEHAGMLPSRA